MNWQISTLIVGVDGSEGSHKAAEIGVSIARHWKAKAIFATVVRPPEGWWGIGGAPPTPEALSTALIEGQRQVLDQLVDQLDLDGVDYETVEELGDPTTRLLAVAKACEADLMIIGKRGASIAERILLGSTADRLSQLAQCPLLIVP